MAIKDEKKAKKNWRANKNPFKMYKENDIVFIDFFYISLEIKP